MSDLYPTCIYCHRFVVGDPDEHICSDCYDDDEPEVGDCPDCGAWDGDSCSIWCPTRGRDALNPNDEP